MTKRLRGPLARRIATVTLTAVVLYFFAPALIAVVSTWDDVSEIQPWWLAAMAAGQAASIWCLWRLQALCIGTEDRFAVATSQLGGGALGRVIPGGSATAAAAQYGMFAASTDDEVRRSAVATGLALATALQVAGLCALPLLALPAVLLGLKLPDTFAQTALLGLAVFGGMAVITALANRSEPILHGIGDALGWAGDRIPAFNPPENLGDLLVSIRNDARSRLGSKLTEAVAATLGRWIFDFLVLVSAVLALGASPDLWLLLLAFFTAQLLAQVAITPGGIGVVEAGLTGALAVAGLTGAQASIATLAYRLFNYGLMLPAGLVGWGLHRNRLRLAGREEYDPGELMGPGR